MFYRFRQEFIDSDTVATDKQCARRTKGVGEGGYSRRRMPAASALDFNRRHRLVGAHHEIHFSVAVAPVEDLA